MISEYLYYASAISHQMTVAQFELHPANPAYIDPGTGSLLIQIAIGALVGGLVFAKLAWRRIVGFIKGLLFWSSRHDKAGD